MVHVTNKRILFKELASGLPISGQTTVFDASQVIDLENVALNGGILVKTRVLSLEPAILVRMRTDLFTSFTSGEPLQNSGIVVVLRSENPAFRVGDHLHGLFPFAEYSIHHETEGFNKVDNEHNLPWSVFVGIAGYAGMTAYSGWKEYSHAKKGEVAFVTSGAGAVGSLVIQLAKRDGVKVIASAGSDDKVQFMKELGADVAFNYKTTKTSEILAQEGPIDVFWDNVGGEALDEALKSAANHARFIECGLVTGYASTVPPVSNFLNVLAKEITIYGFRVWSIMSKYKEDFEREVPALLASKQLTYRENVTVGLEHAEEAFINFMNGEFIGKSIIKVGDD